MDASQHRRSVEVVNAGSGDVQLVLVSNPHVNTSEDFEELARWVHEVDAGVHVEIVSDTRADPGVQWALPTLVVSFVPVMHVRSPRGRMLQGRHLPKSEEYRRLEQHGIAVPRWVRLGPNEQVTLEGFGTYVVTKPDFGARGADVRICRSTRVAWRSPRTRQALQLGGYLNPMLAQEFIYTGHWPISMRVVTLLGEVLWATRIEANRQRPPLRDADAFSSGGYSVVSSGRGCTFSLCHEPDVLQLAQAAHVAFPDVPLLGIDVVRDAASGKLYVIEANSLGYTWHFTSQRGLAMQSQFNLDLDAQFGGRRRAARRLARACRELAT